MEHAWRDARHPHVLVWMTNEQALRKLEEGQPITPIEGVVALTRKLERSLVDACMYADDE